MVDSPFSRTEGPGLSLRDGWLFISRGGGRSSSPSLLGMGSYLVAIQALHFFTQARRLLQSTITKNLGAQMCSLARVGRERFHVLTATCTQVLPHPTAA